MSAREAAIQAVKDHPSTTFMAPCESLADAVLEAATPLIRAEVLLEAIGPVLDLRQFEKNLPTPRGSAQVSENAALLKAADKLRNLAEDAVDTPVPYALTEQAEGGQLADKFQPGHTYTDPQFGWRFRVDTITAHPKDGEVVALGWRFWHGWEPYAYGEDDRLIWQDEGTGGGALT